MGDHADARHMLEGSGLDAEPTGSSGLGYAELAEPGRRSHRRYQRNLQVRHPEAWQYLAY